jgi:DNA relaxase NicK
MEGDDGGYTLYIGKRSSRVYARLYNKEVESDDAYYEGAWRYECELHNATATETAQELHYSLFPLEEAICSAVWSYWHGKGVRPVFDTFPTGMEIVLPRREETTIERSIRWLETQVRPTVAKLVALGYTSSVLDALGLPGADTGHNS